MKKGVLIICGIIILIVALFFGIRVITSNNANNIGGNGESNNISNKEEIKKNITKFTLRVQDGQYDKDIEFNFVNKTKTIIKYTSESWEHTDEIVSYSKFDKLFEYLYNTVFQNTENIINTSNSSKETGMKPLYSMFVAFNTTSEVKTLSSNWHSYINSVSNKAGWTLNGDRYPSYWNELKQIMEIE